MNEPANLTAWVDRGGDTWVRVDEPQRPDQWGPWWPLTDGPGWEPWARGGLGQPRPWNQVEEHGPFVKADADLTRMAVDKVRQRLAAAS